MDTGCDIDCGVSSVVLSFGETFYLSVHFLTCGRLYWVGLWESINPPILVWFLHKDYGYEIVIFVCRFPRSRKFTFVDLRDPMYTQTYCGFFMSSHSCHRPCTNRTTWLRPAFLDALVADSIPIP